ncbi:MAG: hypothetical protein AAGH15_13540, partial [Myxococcota bacterium]
IPTPSAPLEPERPGLLGVIAATPPSPRGVPGGGLAGRGAPGPHLGALALTSGVLLVVSIVVATRLTARRVLG